MVREDAVPSWAWLTAFGGRQKSADPSDRGIDERIKKRRFDEVSHALARDQVEARARLAASRGGPPVDLWRFYREDQKSPLGKRCGEHLKPHFPSLVTTAVGRPAPDETAKGLATAANALARHEFREAANRYANLRLRFPEADAAQEWAYGEALTRAAAGEREAARAAAADAVALDRNSRLRESASRLRLALAGDGDHDWHVLAWKDRVRKVVDDVYRKQHGNAYLRWPSQIRVLTRWEGFETAMVKATPEALAALIDAGAMPWMGVSVPGRVRVYGVSAVSTDIGLVALDNGILLHWDDLLESSMWGDLAIVGRVAGSAPEAPALDYNPFLEGPPSLPDGDIAFDPTTVEVLREGVRRHPDQFITHASLLGVLGQLTRSRRYGTGFADLYSRAIAESRLRFPDSPVPLNHRVSYLVDASSSDAVVLAAADDESGFGLTADSAAALGLRDHPATDYYLREAMLRDPLNLEYIRYWVNASLRAGDVDEVESAIELIRAREPAHGSLAVFDARVAHARRGARAYLDETKPSEELRELRASASLRTLDPEIVRKGADESFGFHADSFAGRYARVFAEICAGDGEAALAAARLEAQTWGLNDPLLDAIAVIGAMMLPEERGAGVLEAIGPLMQSQVRQADYLANVLSWTWRWPLALEIGERLARADSPSGETLWAHVQRLARVASRRDTGDPRPLRARALELIRAIEPLENRLDHFRVLRASLLRHDNPDAAWDVLTARVDSAEPVHAWAVGAAIAEQRGDAEGAARLRARAAVPPALRHSVSGAYRLGILAEYRPVLPLLDPVASATTRARLYGLGLVGPLPASSDVEWSDALDQTIGRLAADGAWDHLGAGVRSRLGRWWDVTGVSDAGLVVASAALVDAARGEPEPLARLVDTSRHPAVARAAILASRHGLGFDDAAATLAASAPGAGVAEVLL